VVVLREGTPRRCDLSSRRSAATPETLVCIPRCKLANRVAGGPSVSSSIVTWHLGMQGIHTPEKCEESGVNLQILRTYTTFYANVNNKL